MFTLEIERTAIIYIYIIYIYISMLVDCPACMVTQESIYTYKIKRSFFQVAFVSILPYGCTTWTLSKHME